MPKWVAGVVASVVGTLSSGLGDNLVRRSYRNLADVPEDEWPPTYKRPLWILGWTLTTVMDTGCTAVALALAPMSLIVPLGALHILWGTIFAQIVNKEPLRPIDALGALFIVAGVVLVLLSSAKSTIHDTYDNTIALTYQPAFLLDQGVTAALIAVCVYLTFFAPFPSLRRVSAPTLPGLLGSSSNLFLKLTESLAAAKGGNAPHRWSFWVVAVSTVLLAACQLTSLNHALATGEAVIVVPIANAVLLIGGTIAGLLVFDESSPTDADLGLLSGGVVLSVCGLSILTTRPDTLEAIEEEDKLLSPDTRVQSYATAVETRINVQEPHQPVSPVSNAG